MGNMLNDRQSKLLGFIVKEYIKTACPIGSAFVSKKPYFKLSSATIRGEMNELETKGYLMQLHTSGGRIPTDKAYRFYVDNLISLENLVPNEREQKLIKTAINKVNNPQILNKTIANVLSDLSENLVITNITESTDFYKTGLSSLFEMPEFREFDKAFRLTSFFDEFDSLFNRLVHDFFDEEFDQNLQMFIGHENPVKNVRDGTVILAKYSLPQNYTGSLTLIGPTRMNYKKNIGLVRYTVNELNKVAS